jgi:hypothetical protein
MKDRHPTVLVSDDLLQRLAFLNLLVRRGRGIGFWIHSCYFLPWPFLPCLGAATFCSRNLSDCQYRK